MKPKQLLLFALCGIVLIGCTGHSRRVNMFLDGKYPPRFAFVGSWSDFHLQVSELPPIFTELWEEHRFTKEKVIWSISCDSLFSDCTPPITFGVLPNGFTQLIPETNDHPELNEGTVYRVSGYNKDSNGGECVFTIRNGKSLVLSPCEAFRCPPGSDIPPFCEIQKSQ